MTSRTEKSVVTPSLAKNGKISVSESEPLCCIFGHCDKEAEAAPIKRLYWFVTFQEPHYLLCTLQWKMDMPGTQHFVLCKEVVLFWSVISEFH